MEIIYKFILKLLLPILFVAITMSFIAEYIVVTTISDDVLEKRISGYIQDEMMNEVDSHTSDTIAKQLENSPYMEEITKKYVDVLTGKSEQLDIQEEVNQILNNELKDVVPENLKDDIKSYVQTESEEILNKAENVMEGNVTEVVTSYSKMTSPVFRITCIILCLLDLMILIVLEKREVLRTIQNSMFITAIISVLIFRGIETISPIVEQYLSGGWINHIQVDLLVVCIIAEIVIAFIILLTRKVIEMKKTLKTEGDDNK